MGAIEFFFSKKLQPAETRYSAFDRELLAIYQSIKRFRSMVEGREFCVYTDHKPLITAIASKTERSPRQIRHLEYIAQFSTDIRHISGRDNLVADYLSRPTIAECFSIVLSGLDIERLMKLQEADAELRNLFTNQEQSQFKLEQYDAGADVKVWCEVSTNVKRPYIPLDMRQEVFNKLHNLSHGGVRATRKLVASKFFWPKMNTDSGTWAKTCLHCQRSKVIRHTKSPVQNIEMPSSRFEHIHMDIVGPLPPSQGYVYLLTVVDRFTRWPEAYPMINSTAITVAKTFASQYIARFGCPHTITTDQGRQFEATLFSELCKLIGLHRIRTTSYHPQSNGLVERMHRNLKESLKARGNTEHWSDEFPLVLLGIRTAIIEDMNCSPADLVYGQGLKLPGEIFVKHSEKNKIDLTNFVDRLRQNMRNLRPTSTRETKKQIYIPKDLGTCEYVFIRTDRVKVGLDNPYEGPFQVIRRFRKHFVINVNGKNQTISIDRLKPAHMVKSLLIKEARNHQGKSIRRVRFEE